jgi:alpha-D-xyloside xylohydrolase
MAGSVLNAPEGFEWLKSLSSWRQIDHQLEVDALDSQGLNVKIRITREMERVWRVRFAPGGDSFPDLGILVNENEPLPLHVTEELDQLVVSNGEENFHIQRDPWCISLQDKNGKEICRENPFDVDGLNRLFILPLGFVRDPGGKIKCITESFHLRPDEHIYGLGEKFTRLDKVGQLVTSWTLDALGAASERAYKNVPFLLSTAGYGLFIHTGRRCTFNFGTESCETYTIQVDGPSLDYFVIVGDTPAEIIRSYSLLTGFAPVPPKWSFGLWLSGSGVYRNEAGIRSLAEGVNRYDIPCDVIHIDPWWMRWRKYADYEWDQQSFPDPNGLISDLHDDGLRLSLWQHPYISIESHLFAEGKQKGYFVLNPDGDVYIIDYGLSLSTVPGGVTEVADEASSWNASVVIVDLTNPEAVEWYKSLMRPVLSQGVDVFKTDFGEDIPEDARFANGMTGAEMHNLYPHYYNRMVFEVTQEIKGEGVVWSRSGWAGNQRYPTCWSGDPACEWDSMAFTLRGGLSLGLSGVPFWSHDVGGYRGHPTEKLYIRWAQFGMFCSHTRCHGESQREPWFFGDRALDIFRRYARLRYQLFPYIYSCAHEASKTGIPVLRAMLLEFSDDVNCYDKELQYMFGPWFLVAPIFNESDERSIYLPPGHWNDYWTGEKIQGPSNIVIKAQLDRLPLFVRNGAVIPMIEPANRIPLHYIDPLILDIYPSEAFAYRFLEDEGITEIHGDQTEYGLEISWEGPTPRAFVIRLHTGWLPQKVSIITPSGERELDWQEINEGVLQIEIPECESASLEIRR